MNKELVINKPVCPKCGKSLWKTVKSNKEYQCRSCGEITEHIETKRIIEVKEVVKEVEAKKENSPEDIRKDANVEKVNN